MVLATFAGTKVARPPRRNPANTIQDKMWEIEIPLEQMV